MAGLQSRLLQFSEKKKHNKLAKEVSLLLLVGSVPVRIVLLLKGLGRKMGDVLSGVGYRWVECSNGLVEERLVSAGPLSKILRKKLGRLLKRNQKLRVGSKW